MVERLEKLFCAMFKFEALLEREHHIGCKYDHNFLSSEDYCDMIRFIKGRGFSCRKAVGAYLMVPRLILCWAGEKAVRVMRGGNWVEKSVEK